MTKIGTIIGDKLFTPEAAEMPRHFTHAMHDGNVCYVSVYQSRYRVPQDTRPIYNDGLREATT